jgi:hypothetical protein
VTDALTRPRPRLRFEAIGYAIEFCGRYQTDAAYAAIVDATYAAITGAASGFTLKASRSEKREKVERLARDPGATPGERAAAHAALKRLR